MRVAKNPFDLERISRGRMRHTVSKEGSLRKNMMNKKTWEQAVAFHGHECPGLAIGYRAVEAAVRELKIAPSRDEEIVCVTENDACGVDAVQALLSCTVGKGNLVFRPTGKQAFSFFNRKDGKAIRVYLKAQNEEGLERPQWQEKLLTLPLDDVFEFSQPTFDPPIQARLFSTVVCEECGEGAPEYRMHFQEGKKVCADCFRSYQRGWF